ncbi:MAG: hypothetical protein Tsb0010_08890 [Parvularculaceae bacterium]
MPAPNLPEDQTKKIVSRAQARFEAMRQQRTPHENMWRQISEFIAPRRDFNLRFGDNPVRPRRMVDTTARTANERLAALLFGYMTPPHSPWTKPRLKGRAATAEESRWFDHVERRMFEELQSPLGSSAAQLQTS